MTDTVWEDHSEELAALNSWLEIDPARTAVITIDMHRGHLGGDDATMPVTDEVAERVQGATHKFLRFARESGLPVIHAILTWRPEEAYRFSPRVEASRTVFSTDAPLTRALAEGTFHNLAGSVQCELMPEIGPEPGDFIINSKKTQSIYYGTELEVLLGTFLDVDTLIIMGSTPTTVCNAPPSRA